MHTALLEKPASRNTREKLLETALDLFWRQSFGAVSVEDICRRSGVHKGSFYHFFPSKSELAAAAFQQFWSDSRPQLDAAFSPALTPVERVRAYCALIHAHQEEKLRLHGKVLGCPFSACGEELATQDEHIRLTIDGIFASYTRYFETLARDAQAAGGAQTGDPARIAQEMVAYAEGVVQQAKFRNDLGVIRQLLLPGLLQYVDQNAACEVRKSA